MSGPAPSFLEVRDLRVHFDTDDGLVRSVDGLSFALKQQKTISKFNYLRKCGPLESEVLLR